MYCNLNPFRTAVPAEGTHEYDMNLTSMANYNTGHILLKLPKMV